MLNVCNSFLLNFCYLLYSSIFVVRCVFCFSRFCLLCDFHIFSLYCIYLFVCPLLLFTFHWWNLDDFALPRDLLLQMFFFEQLLIFKKLQIFLYFMHTFIYIYIHIYKYIGEILFGIYTSILHKSITCFNCSLGELWWMGGGAWFSHGMAFLRYLFC